MNNTISAGKHLINISAEAGSRLVSLPGEFAFKPGKILLLTDENTYVYCAPVFKSYFPLPVTDIIIPAGEKKKNIDSCMLIWKSLLSNTADRNSLLINLGGGMLTDIGGFTASTFMRGIKFINIPTSLLGMVDASAGGKTGIDIDEYKNMIGLFAFPEAVIVEPVFLRTLPQNEWKNGVAEMIKHSLISGSETWKHFLFFLQQNGGEEISGRGREFLLQRMQESINVKASIVAKDPFEKLERKFLNFGHTIGHAIESWSLKNEEVPLSHGEAIAIGMIAELYISSKLFSWEHQELKIFSSAIKNFFPPYTIEEDRYNGIIELMKHDKKASESKITMSLLKAVGNPVIQVVDDVQLMKDALSFYNSI
jgi:3-dehydroquinate synthase